LERIEFPITGNLRPGDVLRTIYLDRDECEVRDTDSAEGRNIFEMALDDYEPGCKQEVWNINGSGAFVHRDWKDSLTLPNLIITLDAAGNRRFLLSNQDGTKVKDLDDGRQITIFNKLLKSSHYSPMSREDYQQWLIEYKIWFRNTPHS